MHIFMPQKYIQRSQGHELTDWTIRLHEQGNGKVILWK